jgi:hypothetical protein
VTKIIQEIGGGHTFQLNLESKNFSDTNAGQRHPKKRKLQTNVLHKCGHKNPQSLETENSEEFPS